MPDKTTYTGVPQQVRTGAAAVIFNDARGILLQPRGDNGYWGLPGRAIRPGRDERRHHGTPGARGDRL